MKKVILSILAIALVSFTLSAKKKTTPSVVLDFTQGNPLTAVQGTTPEKVTITNPAFGLTIPAKAFKEVADAEAAGYVSCPNAEKATEGFYFPFSKQSFQSAGNAYELTIGTQAAKGRKCVLAYRKNALYTSRLAFTVPQVTGMIPAGVKITVKTGKKVSPKAVFKVFKNKLSSKAVIATTNAPEEVNAEAVLAANFEEVTAEDNIIVATSAGFNITKIEFLYNKAPKAGKAPKGKKK